MGKIPGKCYQQDIKNKNYEKIFIENFRHTLFHGYLLKKSCATYDVAKVVKFLFINSDRKIRIDKNTNPASKNVTYFSFD